MIIQQYDKKNQFALFPHCTCPTRAFVDLLSLRKVPSVFSIFSSPKVESKTPARLVQKRPTLGACAKCQVSSPSSPRPRWSPRHPPGWCKRGPHWVPASVLCPPRAPRPPPAMVVLG